MNTITPSLPIQFTNPIGSQSRGQPQANVQPQVGQLLTAKVVEAQADNRFLLQIGESKISANSDLPLKVGQTLQLQVISSSPQVELKIVSDTVSHFLGKSLTFIGKNLDISALFSSLQQRPGQTGGQPGPPMQQSAMTAAAGQFAAAQLKGAVFSSEVTAQQADNRFVLQAGNTKITVETQAPLRTGQPLELQVTETAPRFQVKIVGDAPPQLLGQSLLVVDKPADVGVLLLNPAQKASIFEILSPQSRSILGDFHTLQQNQLEGKNNGENLKLLVDKLGLSFESHLARGETAKAAATLKAALFEILSSFKNAEQVTKSTNQLLSTLELFQLAQLQTETGHQFIFPLPLPFLEQGYLVVDKDSGDGQDNSSKENEERRFSLHLKMSDIGNLRIDFYQTGDGLLIRFHTDSRDKADFVKENSKELEQALADVPLLGLSFGTEADDPANELLRHVIPEGKSVLKTKV